MRTEIDSAKWTGHSGIRGITVIVDRPGLYIAVQMDASSTGICRAVFPDRKTELATTGASVAVHLRRKGLVMRGAGPQTWRLTAKGREAYARHQNLGSNPLSATR